MMKTLIEKLETEIANRDKQFSQIVNTITPDMATAHVGTIVGLNTALDIVKEHSEWVSCSERLPQPDTTVLVYEDFWKQDTRIFTARLLDGEFIAYPGFHKTVNVTHWQPLPQPPSEVQSG